MIIDNIRNIDSYAGMGEGLKAGLAYLAGTDFSKMAAGRYDLDGDKLYVLVQTYESKLPAEGKWEAHRRYADIQFIVSGREIIGCVDIAALRAVQEYDAARDFQLLEGQGNSLVLTPGTFMILLPQDAHMPGMAAGKPEPVRKVVVKICL